MEEEKTKDNVVPDEKKLEVEKVLNDYSLQELNSQACENLLLGSFDKDKKYKILDIIYSELVNLKKVIQKNNNESYVAISVINNLKLNFEVKFEAKEENKMSATLILHEKFVVGGIYETTLSTDLQTLVGENNVEFLALVKKTFHLYNADEDDQQELLENYISPPIELVGELLKKTEMLDAYKLLWENFEKNYINDIFNILKKSESGQKIIKKFLQTVKNCDLSDKKDDKSHFMKVVFDKILDEEISNKTLEKKQFDEIILIRNTYTEKINVAVKEKLQEQIALLKPETIKPAPPKIEVKQQKSAPSASSKSSSTKSSSSGGSSKSSSSPKKESSAPKKEEKKKPLVAVNFPAKPSQPKPKTQNGQLNSKKQLKVELIEQIDLTADNLNRLNSKQNAEQINENEFERAEHVK